MNRSLTLIIFILAGLNAYSCDCYSPPTIESIDTYKNIFVAEVKSGVATVIKTWTGDYKVGTTFQYEVFDYNCDMYSALDNSTLVFFLNSKKNQFCPTTVMYYHFNDVEYLDQKYRKTVSFSPNSIKYLDSLEYERKYVIYYKGKNDTKDKKVVFIELVRNPFFNSFRVIEQSDIRKRIGFYSTFIILLEKNYTSEYCKYDYVFLVSTSHNPPRITDRVRKIITRKAKKVCKQKSFKDGKTTF